MSFDPFAFIELWVVLAFVVAWLILEWQGRRLDRAKERREREESQAATTHLAQEKHDSHGGSPPAG